MGIFSALLGRDKSTATAPACEPLSVYAPAEGRVIPLEQFPDEVFCQGILGSGCGILPTGNMVTAPFNGKIVQASDTLHAVGLLGDEGVELLIHVGVDTVEMGGKGFKYFVKDGQRVKRGDPLIGFDREGIKAAGYSDAIAVVVTNSDDFSAVDLQTTGATTSGTLILKVKK